MKKVFALLLSAGMFAAVACNPQASQESEEKALQDSLEMAAQADSIAAAEQAAAEESADSVSADSL
ncbi:hypothetical protein EDD80_10693 [Anseongella ginsenosidimutans]|uniref:Lipoprotein n=1 Tax=Anseongella ginsenosidimutans TaxID=496056 RepID=A0A4R3KR00_9SPHI|nr:hypothetical protein [Anseongella ginsenosidimutans]QEC52232.1 hypothetical protein FRZ59_07710 [Anseongella ginsenosidimutans]TCS86783.1 hypothetical protein EDD80_10693 [Anseongella ginsenosidimutans]